MGNGLFGLEDKESSAEAFGTEKIISIGWQVNAIDDLFREIVIRSAPDLLLFLLFFRGHLVKFEAVVEAELLKAVLVCRCGMNELIESIESHANSPSNHKHDPAARLKSSSAPQ